MNEWGGPKGPVRLPVRVDLGACQAEMTQIKEWGALQMYDGKWVADWRAFSLVGYSKDPLDVQSPYTILSTERAQGRRGVNKTLHPTMLMETTAAVNFPACMEVAASLLGKNERVRINYVGPGSILPKHRDVLEGELLVPWEERKVIRFHVPILSGRGCVFIAWDRLGGCHEICQPEGSVWYVDTDQPHMVANGTKEGRYNLVVDKFLDQDLRDLLVGKSMIRGVAP